MTIINKNTTKGKNMILNAMNYQGFFLDDVYGSYSRAKKNAWEYCLALCEKENGDLFHIFSHNTFGFSVAWETPEGTRIETAKNSYLIK